MHFEGPFLHVSGMTKPLLANNATMMVESPAGGFRFTLYRLVERLKSRGVYQVFPKGVSIKGLARGLGKFLLKSGDRYDAPEKRTLPKSSRVLTPYLDHLNVGTARAN